MPNKTIFILIDGMDYSFIEKNLNKLDFFKQLKEQNQLTLLESVIPADSVPSWTTIYTGMNPAEHGIIESIDYLQLKKSSKNDYSIIKGHTFWDEIGKRGKKVFILNPFMAYPAWDVNGLMISGPAFEGGDISTNQPDLVNISELPSLGGSVDFPTKKSIVSFFNKTIDLTQQQFDSFHQYFKLQQFDFAFLGILTLDRIQHFLWKYIDPEDSCYPKNNPLQDSIFGAYKLIERNIQEIFNIYSKEYNIIVISDHGHGRRCQKTFYINQWLIQNWYLKDKSKKKRMIEFTKNLVLLLLAKVHCVEFGTKFLKNFSIFHKVKNSDYIFNDKIKKIYAPKFDGTNPFGGVSVNRKEFNSDEEYFAILDEIRTKLLAIKDKGKPIMEWVKLREEIYTGINVENYPEIIYKMDRNYGVDRGLFGRKIFGINAFHEVISGGHQLEGVILSNVKLLESHYSVLQIYDMIINSIY